MTHPLDPGMQNALAGYYLLAALLNAGFAAYYYRAASNKSAAVLWGAVAGLFLLHALLYAVHHGPTLPEGARSAVNAVMGPVTYSTLSAVGFVLLLVYRRFFTRPQVAWAVLNLSLLAAGWALTDPEFQKIVGKPDNVPIPMLIYSVGFFTWLALYRAVENDNRIKNGQPVLEKLDDEKVLVWPD